MSAEYLGELCFGSGSLPPPVPLIHVYTEDGRVRRIVIQDRHRHPSRFEAYDFVGFCVVRYQTYGLGEEETRLDLLHAGFLYPKDTERINEWGDLLLRHFKALAGCYHRVSSSSRLP